MIVATNQERWKCNTTTTKHHDPYNKRKISLHRQELSPTGIEAGQVGSEDASWTAAHPDKLVTVVVQTMRS